MKLYLVSRTGPIRADDLVSVVVRAADEHTARQIAWDDSAGDASDVWMQEATCEELISSGDAGVICRDFYEA